MSFPNKLSRLVALLGSIFTLVQIFLIASNKEAICLNDGCKVVDSLTTVPPLFINIGGFVFFQLVFWGLWAARQDKNRLQYVNIILLAGLAAEGVLVSFQHFVAQTFCSYCLIILGIVVALNLLAGMRQILSGTAVFVAVLLGFASLQFGPAATSPLQDLDEGSFAYTAGEDGEKRYLFFSSTCKYCEKIIESLNDENECAIRFNPIDEITEFALDTAQRTESYDIAVNRKLLQSMGLKQIPVLLVSSASGFQVITGAGGIDQYLSDRCQGEQEIPPATVSPGYSVSPGLEFLPPADESCAVDIDCDDPTLIPQGN